ncbi:MAG: hypothetical protein K1Y36_25970 [Blastocatellia bacterium]|nr:hypothetical protein [Blastocatellia bacterium]
MRRTVQKLISSGLTFGLLGLTGLASTPFSAPLPPPPSGKTPVLNVVLQTFGSLKGFDPSKFFSTLKQVAQTYNVPLSKTLRGKIAQAEARNQNPFGIRQASLQDGKPAVAPVAYKSALPPQEEATASDDEDVFTMYVFIGTDDADDDDDGTPDAKDTDKDGDGVEDAKEEQQVFEIDKEWKDGTDFVDNDKDKGIFIEIFDGEKHHQIRLETEGDSLEDTASAALDRFHGADVQLMRAAYVKTGNPFAAPVRSGAKLNRNDILTATSIITTFGGPALSMGASGANLLGKGEAAKELKDGANLIKAAESSGLAREGAKLAVQVLNTKDAYNRFNQTKR